MGSSSTSVTVGFDEYQCCPGGCLPVMGVLRNMFLIVVYLTLTDPLRIQPWSQDKRNQTKSNREQKKAGKADRRNEQESSQQMTSSPGTETEQTKHKVKVSVYASPEARRVSCHMYLDGQQYLCYCVFFNTIAAPVENILLYTGYITARR